MHTRSFLTVFSLLSAGALLAGLMTLLMCFSPTQAADETFWVDSTADSADSTPGDCICRNAGGDCTLRAAIEEANACSGGQTIRFNIGTTATIVPASALPIITDDYTVIDGSDEWYEWSGTPVPGVTIDGASLPSNGLVITASHCAIYGLHIINFDQVGILVFDAAEDNHIGGEGENQCNVITKNGENGVLILGSDARNNVVSSNYIGTNVKGYYELNGGNGYHGVSVWFGDGNVITNNLISFNKWSGATMDAVNTGTIANNRIGMDVMWNSLPNSYYGIHIANMAKPQIHSNYIAFNKRGILVAGGARASIEENYIYENDATSLSEPEGGGVLITGTLTHADLLHNHIFGNTALFGGGVAVEENTSAIIDHNEIRENEAVIYTNGSVGGGGIFVYSSTITATYNTIISNTVSGPNGPMYYASGSGGGILLEKADPAWIIGNEIHGNSILGNSGGGGGVRILKGGDIWLSRNVIVNNKLNTVSTGGSGIEINSTSPSTRIWIDANLVEGNSTSTGGAVFAINSDYITLTNNLIVNNLDPGLYLWNSGDHIQSNFNTIAMNTGSGIILNDADLYLYNTLVISNTGYGIKKDGTLWSMTSTRNDVWGNELGASSETGDSFYLETDPLFFNANEGMFALHPESPCIDVGDYGHPVSTSYNNAPRPIGVGYDMGAYEMPVPTYLPVLLR